MRGSVSVKAALTRRQEVAAVALLSTPTLDEAARASRVPIRTLRRWVAEDEIFRQAIAELRRASWRQAAGKLAAVAGEAVEALVGVLRDQGAPAGARVGAARTLLEFARQAIELEDLASRVEALEQRADPERPAGGSVWSV
jgi:hypothetical protein